MMRPRHLLVAAMLLGLGACSALRPDPDRERDASYRLDRGLAALEAGRYREAFDDLAWVYTHCPDRTRGAEALVALSAIELDPRNDGGRPEVGTELLGQWLQDPASPHHVRPLAESAYLMALSLGAPPGSAPEAASGSAVVRDSAVGAAAAPSGAAARVLAQRSDEAASGCGAGMGGESLPPAPLPALPGPSLASLLTAAERARDASVADADSLRSALEAARQRLQETEAELERIRQTLKP